MSQSLLLCQHLSLTPDFSLPEWSRHTNLSLHFFFLFLFLVRCWLSLLDSDLSLSWLDLNTSEHTLIDEKPTFQVPSCRMFSVCMLDSTDIGNFTGVFTGRSQLSPVHTEILLLESPRMENPSRTPPLCILHSLTPLPYLRGVFASP